MRTRFSRGIMAVVGSIVTLGLGTSLAQEVPVAPYAAIPSERGGQDLFGAYDVDASWPKDIATLPGHSDWTFGAGQGVFAESPDRVIYLQRGELPNVEPPEFRLLPEIAPSAGYPNGAWRNATRASLPANGGTGGIAEDGIKAWIERGGRLDVDARWEHCILVFDREGNVIEAWTQWDSMLQRPHFVTINPYDPDKNVWIIDDHKHVIHKFTNDGSTLLQTIGTYGEPGADEDHFNRPTFLAFAPDSSFYVADGYNGTRVVKFDADGNYVTSWGQKGTPPNETRPAYWNNVHGVAIDPETGRVFVNDRGNRRIQVFDADGNYLYEWSIGPRPLSVHLIVIPADRTLWAFDRVANQMIHYDLEGNLLYTWGVKGQFPGAFSGVHGISVDQEGNLYLAQVDDRGGVQKFVPREGANPVYLVGKPLYAAWD